MVAPDSTPAERLAESIESHARRTPERLAIAHLDRAVGYAELASLLDGMAGWMHSLGVRSGEWIALTVRDELRHLLASLALVRLGCHQVCLPSFEPLSSRSRIAERLPLSRHVVDGGESPVPGVPVLELPSDAECLRFAGTVPVGHEASDGASIVFTSSGTTGKAKLIQVSQHTVFESARLFSNPPTTLSLSAPLEHNLSKLSTFRMIVFGGGAVLSSVRDCFDLPDMCARFSVTHMLLFAFSAKGVLADLDRRPGARPLLPDLVVTLSGSRIGADLMRRFQEVVSPKTVVTYGAMEIGLISRATAGHLERDGESVGVPVPGVAVEIVDDADRPVPAGQTGRIRIASAACATTYLDDPAASARAFRDGWFYPGDLGAMTEDGMLVFRGRADDMMILNSINIFPAEIEAVAEAFAGVLDCAAFPKNSPLHGQIPILAVVADPSLDIQSLMRHCRERLGNRSPRKIVRVDHLPRNAAGKLLRAALESQVDAMTTAV